jgi:hypothetical protein
MKKGNMTEKLHIEAFHGTDKAFVPGILRDKFVCKKNDEHWLGNGIYLFSDCSLAEWWTTNPTINFGTRIKEGAIIKCEMEVDPEDVLDLRNLEDYKQFAEIYRTEFLPMLYTGFFVDPSSSKVQFLNFKKVRCFYCDYLKNRYDLKMIIGNFYLPNQPYMPKEYGELFLKFNITYIETQLCIFDQSIIFNKEFIDLSVRR